MEGDKDKFLAVASPEEWDCWLTVRADHFAARRNQAEERRDKDLLGRKFGANCLFCLAYGYQCWECKVEEDEENPPCLGEHNFEVIDLAIRRLEDAGIWE